MNFEIKNRKAYKFNIKKSIKVIALIFLLLSLISIISIITVLSLMPSNIVGININVVSADSNISKTNNNPSTGSNDTSPIKILMVGDIVATPPLDQEIIKENKNPLIYVTKEFKKYNLVIGNLESTIDGKSYGAQQIKPYSMSSPYHFIDKLYESGIGAVSLANNHDKDYGPGGIMNTIYNVNQNGIYTFGAGSDDASAFKPTIININGTKIGLLGFDSAEYLLNKSSPNIAGTGWFGTNLVKNAIQDARSNSDIVIVWPHWGVEHTPNPDDFQTQWGKIFIDDGADLVVGGHPHVKQPNIVYKGKNIFYSIGDFLITGMGFDPNALKGYALEVSIQDKKISGYKLREVSLDDYGKPTITN